LENGEHRQRNGSVTSKNQNAPLYAARALQLLPRASELHVTPAMEAGITDHVWSIEEIVGLMR
jgi:hypothetical protein